MKLLRRLWKPRSVTYKTHFFSALCRGIFTNSCWIFGTSLLVKVVGSKSFPQLYFYASLLSLLYYIYFAMRGNKGKEPYHVYRMALASAVIFSAGCFLEPFLPFLKPFNEPLLFLFVISVMTVDLIGTTVGPIVLQQSVNPAIFRQVYQTIVTAEGIARVASAALVWVLSQGHLLVYLYPIAWLMLSLHFTLFGVTVWRMRVSELKARPSALSESAPAPRALENVSSSLRFLLSNPLVRIATIIMVWSIITKFVIEYLFYQVADSSFASARQIASFVSILTMTIYLLSLIVHHFVARRLTANLQLSTLLSIQPINILVLGGLALLSPPFWPLVLLMVTYNIIHRSIQMPMSRQCLVPVPRQQRATIVSLISMIIAAATIIVSGGLASLKGGLHLQDILILLLVLGSAIFFAITGLDSFYIRNLWSFLKEFKSGRWEDEPQSESLSAAELEAADAIDDASMAAANADLRSHPVLEAYAFSFDRSQLAEASGEHRRLLDSSNPELLVPALRICLIAGFPWFRADLERATAYGEPQVCRFARHALETDHTFSDSTEMTRHSSVFRRHIKAVAMDILEEVDGDRNSINALESLSKCTDVESAEEIVEVLADPRLAELKMLLLDCIKPDGSLSVQPVIDRMYELNYPAALNCREVLKRLPFAKRSNEVQRVVEGSVTSLGRDNPLLSRNKPQHKDSLLNESMNTDLQLQKFLHTLFLEEYRLSAREADGTLMDSIGEFESLSPDERAIFLDMHLSFLKRSEFFKDWQGLTGIKT